VRQVSADIDSTASVGVLSRLDDPYFLAHLGVPHDIRVAFGVVEDLGKAFELFTVHSFGNMES
jgi:hypothetical protein